MIVFLEPGKFAGHNNRSFGGCVCLRRLVGSRKNILAVSGHLEISFNNYPDNISDVFLLLPNDAIY